MSPVGARSKVHILDLMVAALGRSDFFKNLLKIVPFSERMECCENHRPLSHLKAPPMSFLRNRRKTAVKI